MNSPSVGVFKKSCEAQVYDAIDRKYKLQEVVS